MPRDGIVTIQVALPYSHGNEKPGSVTQQRLAES
jgi:hypothetical protein